jgi:hypothetical protein
MLIEYVKENGVGDISLADLFERWIDMKIRRDLVMPRTHGGPSREGISSSIKTPDLIRHYSVRCMKTAARLMTSVENGHLVLLPNCEFDQISLLELRGHEDMTGLVLNSLLMPDTMVSQRTVRFAHRAFQEYFLASCIKEQNLFTSIILPEQIEIWLRRLHAKGILSG